jgi:hypothetical protein
MPCIEYDDYILILPKACTIAFPPWPCLPFARIARLLPERACDVDRGTRTSVSGRAVQADDPEGGESGGRYFAPR